MIDNLADVVRLINLGLIAVVLILMAVRWRFFLTVERGVQMLVLATIALVLATGWATVETLTARTTVPGVRSWVIMLALCWALAALAMMWRDRR